MKLETIVNGFGALKKVFDSIEKFDEKWKMVPAYKEIKDAIEMYNEERNKIIKNLSTLEGEVKPNKVPELNSQVDDLLKTEIKLKRNLKFDKKQVEKSGILVSEIESILDFMSN